MFPLRRRARIVIAAVLTLSAAIAALLCFSGLRDFSLESATTRTLTFHAGSDRLSGTLILPRDVAAPPVALFVHGDGPQDRYADDGYLPFINQLLDQGIGVFTWDKPGVAAAPATGWTNPCRTAPPRPWPPTCARALRTRRGCRQGRLPGLLASGLGAAHRRQPRATRLHRHHRRRGELA